MPAPAKLRAIEAESPDPAPTINATLFSRFAMTRSPSVDFGHFESHTGVVAGLVPATPNVKAHSDNNRGGRDNPDHDPGDGGGFTMMRACSIRCRSEVRDQENRHGAEKCNEIHLHFHRTLPSRAGTNMRPPSLEFECWDYWVVRFRGR